MAALVVYRRVSDETQRDNTSLDNQMERIQAYCKAHGHKIVGDYFDVETASGRRKRKGFQAALDYVYQGKADGIICMKLDRFARSTSEGLRVASELQANKKQLVIIDLNLDTATAIGQCIFTVLLAFAQLERETITERCVNGRKIKREKGLYSCGSPPYGWVAGVVNGEKMPIPEPTEQYWRNQIFAWYEEGYTCGKIKDKLNALGIPSKRVAKWQTCSVRQVLKRESFLIQWMKHREQVKEDARAS